MDNIQDLMKIAQNKIGGNGTDKPDPIDPAIAQLVNQLFTFFYGICRGFDKQYHDPKRLNIEKTQWMRAFADEGIKHPQQIEHGIKRTRRESPINTPTIGQFIDWCTPSLDSLGIPSTDLAYDEACKNAHPTSDKQWSHKLVAHAAKLTGSYLLSTSPRSVTFPVFQRNYEIAIRDWRAGKTIEEIQPPIALEKIENPLQTAEARKKAMFDIYMRLGYHDLAAKYCDGDANEV